VVTYRTLGAAGWIVARPARRADLGGHALEGGGAGVEVGKKSNHSYQENGWYGRKTKKCQCKGLIVPRSSSSVGPHRGGLQEPGHRRLVGLALQGGSAGVEVILIRLLVLKSLLIKFRGDFSFISIELLTVRQAVHFLGRDYNLTLI
jgi:hypothetical protein